MSKPTVSLVMSRVCGGYKQRLVLLYLAECYDAVLCSTVQCDEIANYCEMGEKETISVLLELLQRDLVTNAFGVFWAMKHDTVLALPRNDAVIADAVRP